MKNRATNIAAIALGVLVVAMEVAASYELLASPAHGQTAPAPPGDVKIPATRVPRVVVIASHVPSDGLRGVAGGLIRGASLYEGNACIPLSSQERITISGPIIISTLVQHKHPVISLESAQASAEVTRSRKAKFAIGVVTFVPKAGQTALVLGAAQKITMSSGWAAALGIGVEVMGIVVDTFSRQADAVKAPLAGLWLQNIPETELTPGKCTPMFRYMSRFPTKDETISVGIE